MRTAGWFAGLVAGLFLLTVAVGTGWRPLADLDHAVAARAFAATAGHDGRVDVWTAITTWGGPGPVRVLLVLGALVALVRRRFDLAAWLVVLTLVEGVVAPAAKLLLARARPSWPDPITVVGSTSFPSGHAAAAATAAVALALVARRPVITCVAAALAVAVAASRVFLGVHYLSDVVGGLWLGAVLALATYAATGWVWDRAATRRTRPRRRTASGPAVG